MSHWDCRYKIHQVYLSDRDKDSASQSVTNFTVTLPTELKNVVAIRPLASAFYENAENVGQIEINGAQLPIRVSTGQGLFLYLNGFENIKTAKNNNVPIFSRVQGDDIYPSVVKDFWKDPYAHVLQPKELRLRRFEVKLYNSSFEPYTPLTPEQATFNIQLAVYCEANNCDFSMADK